MRIAVAAMLVLALAGCDKMGAPSGDSAKQPESKADGYAAKIAELKAESQKRQTPDAAVESLFNVKHLIAQVECYDAKIKRASEDENGIEKLRSNEYLSYFSGQVRKHKAFWFRDDDIDECLKFAEKYSVDIKKVEMETPTRAIVLAKVRNITPIPDGAEVHDFMEEARKDGEEYRYQLNKEKETWAISQIYEFDQYEAKDWKPSYEGDPVRNIEWLASSS